MVESKTWEGTTTMLPNLQRNEGESRKPVPTTVTIVPPTVLPNDGERDVMVAADVYVYAMEDTEYPESCAFVEMDNDTVSGRDGGERHLIVDDEM
jgi:hypothetical protein